MSRSSYDSDYESMISKRKSRSDSFEGSSSRGSSSGAEFSLKKGPWTADEDEILRDHVKKYGEGNWNTVQKRSGLRRCGKSCRLRWTNHLRPNLKKCPFSEEEEKLIIKLHAQLQNKWAQMATQLPGRTDNEIKNFWNTRAKRCQRAGLPLYPPEVCGSPPMIKKHRQLAGHETGNIIASPLAYSFRTNAMPVSCIPYSPSITTFGSPFSQMSRYQINGLHSQSVDLNPSFPCLGGDMDYSVLDKDPLTSSDMIYRPMQWDYGSESAALTPLVNYSTSQVLRAPVKLELPSLQLPEPRFGQHSFTKKVDFYGVSPQMTSDVALPCNDGLLNDIIHGPKAASSNGLKSGGLDDPISPLTGSFSSVEESSGKKKSTGTVALGMDACEDFLMDSMPTQFLEYCQADNLQTWGLGSQ